TSCSSIGSLMAVLLIRSFQKSSRLFDAMESRCYTGKITVLEEEYITDKKEIWFMVLFDIALVMVSVVIHIYG
ncbi:MAG: CbiQ family ECF transporter T component, partial [Clostridiales bacterium]